MKHFSWPLLLLFFCASGIAAHPEFIRTNRPFRIGCELYEFGLFTQRQEWNQSIPQTRGFTSSHIEQELIEIQNWKNEQLRLRRFPRRGIANEAIIASIAEYASIFEHQDVLVLYQWQPTGGAPGAVFREIMAMLTVSRLDWRSDSQLVVEKHQKINIDRVQPIPMSPLKAGPMHWNLPHASRENIDFYSGDLLQVNSLMVTKDQRFPWLPLLYAMGYWHGVLTTGRIIPPNRSLKISATQTIHGPAIFEPTFFIGEGYEHRAEVYERLFFEKVPVSGKLKFSDPNFPEVHLSLMMANVHRFLYRLPMLLEGRIENLENLFATFMGPLSFAPMAIYGAHLPLQFSLAQEVEKAIGPLCNWQVAMHSIPTPGLEIPHSEFWPGAHFQAP